jgi:hypothetical protein
MRFFDNLFGPKQTATVDSVTAGIAAVQKQIDELKLAAASLKEAPVASTEEQQTGPETEVVQGGGARKRSKKGRRTMKNKRNKRTK